MLVAPESSALVDSLATEPAMGDSFRWRSNDQGFKHTHRIHGAGIYANIGDMLMVNVTIYSIHGSYGTYSLPDSSRTVL